VLLQRISMMSMCRAVLMAAPVVVVLTQQLLVHLMIIQHRTMLRSSKAPGYHEANRNGL
jgi:hypothetical protein